VSLTGTYTLTVYGMNGCSNSTTCDVIDNTQQPDVSANGATIQCDEAPVQLDGGSTTAGASFAWSSANGFASSDEDPLVSEVGFYTLTVTGLNGCTSDSTVAVTHAECGKDSCALEMYCPNDTTVNCGTSLLWTVVGQPFFPKKDKDKCNSELSVWWDDVYSGECPVILERTWFGANTMEEMVQCTQTITIIDEEAPELSNVPENVKVDCGSQIPETPKVMALDCSGTWEVVPTEEILTGKGKCDYAILRSWTATDNCGNTTTASQTVTVSDTQAPEFDCASVEMKATCDDKIGPMECSAKDNCDPEVDVTMTEEKIPTDGIGNYDLVWTWTATDDCGNNSTVTEVVHVFCGKVPYSVMRVAAEPNPFNDGTTLRFTAAVDGPATLDVTDPSGRLVQRVFVGKVNAGQQYSGWFDARDNSEGVYYVRLTVGEQSVMSRIVRGR
jgi:hypothetical protein